MPDDIKQPASSSTTPPAAAQTNTHQHESQAAWHAPVAGIIGGVTGGTLTYPFEGAKKRAQSRQLQPWQDKTVYTNPFRFVRELYRGGSSFIFSLAPVSMLQVTINNRLNKAIPENYSPYWSYGAGVFSGAMGAFASAPIEHIILTQQKKKIGPIAAVRHLVNTGGITYPWTALRPLMVREAGFGFTMLMGAEAAGRYLSEKFQRDLMMPAALLVGLFGAGITHPFDTTATKMQMSDHRISMRSAARSIATSNLGWRGFFAGYVFRAFLFTGCMISIGATERKVEKKLAEGSAFNFGFFQSRAEERKVVEVPRANHEHGFDRVKRP